jgi:prevent-host-death family protein
MSTIAETEFLKHPAHYLKAVHGGESLVLSQKGEPSAMVISLSPNLGPREFGLFKGEISVPADFNDPLPDELFSTLAAPLS